MAGESPCRCREARCAQAARQCRQYTVNAARLWRTVRRMTPRQIAWRLVCRGRFALLRRIGPGPVAAAAQRLPLPDPADERLAKLAAHVLPWQQAVHGPHLAAMLGGKFTLLGQSRDFGGVDAVRWRTQEDGNIALWRMTLGYFGYAPPLLATGESGALQAVISLVASLERQNPFRATGVFRDIWNPYCVSHRLINLLLGLHLFERRTAVPAPARAALLEHIRFCAAFVRCNLEWDLGYNHLLKNLTALIVYAAAVPALPRRWRLLHAAVPRAVASQVLPDGGHAERSPMYHLLAQLDLQLLADAGVLSPRSTQAVATHLSAMRKALDALSLPDGDIALFNDAWLGEAPPATAFLARPAEPDDRGTKQVLAESGYVQLGAGANAVVFDCGPCGPEDNPAHAHADFLGIEATVAGRRFLVDAGVSTYNAGALRDRCRSAAAHNGPRLAECEPLECWSSFRVGRGGRAYALPDLVPAADALCCAGWHDGYSGMGVQVARGLALYPQQGLLIVDLWLGAASAATVDFLVPAAWRPLADSRYRHSEEQAAEATFEMLVGTAAPPQPAMYWPCYAAAEDAVRIHVEPAAAGDQRWSVCWLGWNGRSPAADVRAWQANLATAVAGAT